ncbi:SDR family oxidoreductase [Jannaschia aquimarina]|uniref:FabG_10 protein n=1 Tax=Jannaschia aquimarina TaxID=935700 RepID=A0A0D1EGL5_9RHOB|nr:SDR family oxidoreductase [Jannaschia aquimarina]KIT14990.1 3-oxoacyl-[acyl-carrier-protein] reductase FabG [Jannaschia aquimarina]SNS61362.1 NAD(P)-dependent dehydrogenase, short-chain alcohol dehydrogenase family [Jannaschia aquimarina]
MRIDGTSAIVTGGGSGLGAATARHLAARGAKVTILDHDGDKAEAVAAEIGGRAAPCDVTDEARVERAVAAAADAHGTPRIVVNCAGIANAARIVNRKGETGLATFRRVIEVNLIGSYAVAAHTIRLMQEADPLDDERGVVINTSSAAYQDGQVGQSAYAASKGAIASMCLPLARELAKPGIRVCAIAPGLFHTPMMEALPEETVQKITADVQFPQRLGNPHEFAALAAHIVENRYLNGEVIRIDGATRLPPR